jgi:DNA-directed RNA polymerase subunit RPC12/RpoP
VSGRIALHLDKGLGWTKPVFVASCRDCGTELARHTNQATATRAAARTRCPGCGSRAARRLPGSTSPATDLALASGRQAPPGRWRRPLRTVPHQGSVVGREPGTARGRTRPPPPTPSWKEVKAMSRPSLEELLRQFEEDGGGEATDGCWVEPDGSCEHGKPSWLLALGLI